MEDPAFLLTNLCLHWGTWGNSDPGSNVRLADMTITSNFICPQCRDMCDRHEDSHFASTAIVHPLGSDPREKKDLGDLIRETLVHTQMLDNTCPNLPGCGLTLRSLTYRSFHTTSPTLIANIVWGLDERKDEDLGSELVVRDFDIPAEITLLGYNPSFQTPPTPSVWSLCGIVCGVGGLVDTGHYVAIVPFEKNWWVIDDQHTHLVNGSAGAEAFRSGRYPVLVMYERVRHPSLYPPTPTSLPRQQKANGKSSVVALANLGPRLSPIASLVHPAKQSIEVPTKSIETLENPIKTPEQSIENTKRSIDKSSLSIDNSRPSIESSRSAIPKSPALASITRSAIAPPTLPTLGQGIAGPAAIGRWRPRSAFDESKDGNDDEYEEGVGNEDYGQDRMEEQANQEPSTIEHQGPPTETAEPILAPNTGTGASVVRHSIISAFPPLPQDQMIRERRRSEEGGEASDRLCIVRWNSGGSASKLVSRLSLSVQKNKSKELQGMSLSSTIYLAVRNFFVGRLEAQQAPSPTAAADDLIVCLDIEGDFDLKLSDIKRLSDRESWWTLNLIETCVGASLQHLRKIEAPGAIYRRHQAIVYTSALLAWRGPTPLLMWPSGERPWPNLGKDSSWRERTTVSSICSALGHFMTVVIFGPQRLVVPYDGAEGAFDHADVAEVSHRLLFFNHIVGKLIQ